MIKNFNSDKITEKKMTFIHISPLVSIMSFMATYFGHSIQLFVISCYFHLGQFLCQAAAATLSLLHQHKGWHSGSWTPE